MAGGGVDGLALGTVFAGSVFLYAAFTGKSVLKSVQAVVSGKPPSAAPVANPITGGSPASSAAGGGTPLTAAGGSAVANDALRYQGAGYVWGGAPAGGTGDWDCSSFCNWVIGHDLGMAIPGYAAGTYTGSSHGPTTGVWLLWSGAKTIPASQAQPGDLIVWYTHMGIYLGNGQMISALDSQQGTQVTTIAGGSPSGEGPGFYRRLGA